MFNFLFLTAGLYIINIINIRKTKNHKIELKKIRFFNFNIFKLY